MDTSTVIPLLDWLLDAGGLWVAIAVLVWQVRTLSAKLDDCYSEICEQFEQDRLDRRA